jgi:hypothetical protein
MPTWRQGQAVGEWRQMSGTALSTAPIAVKTYPTLGVEGPEAKSTNWTGFAIDTRDSSVYSVANGGHWAYAGNEVNRIKLADNAPVWTEPRAATPASQVMAGVTHYADGRPTSRHSYYGTVVNEVRGRVMTFGGGSYGPGLLLTTVDGLNLAANDWDTARTYPDVPPEYTAAAGAAVAVQKSTGDVFAFTRYNVYRWSSASNTWSRQLANTPFYGQYAASAVDTRRNRVLVLGGLINDRGVYDVASNTMQAVTLSGPDAGSVAGDGNGMVYDPLQDAFLVRKGAAGGTIYRINAQTFAVDTMPTGSTGAQIPGAVNNVWTRFLYVPALKGVVYFPAFNGNSWFLRTN